MAASAGTPRPVAVAYPPIPLRRRLYGFGSVYGKTIRDSRLAFIIAAGLLGGMSLLMGAAVPTIFPTPEARQDINNLFGACRPRWSTCSASPSALGTLGGYMTWKYGAIFAMGTILWSITALSGPSPREARRGSLDFVATTPFGKRRVALEKLAAHLTLLWLTMAILAVATRSARCVFGDAALGDSISLVSGLGFALWIGSLAMFFGGLAFLLSPILGRAGAGGIAAIAMLVLWLANGVAGLDVARADQPVPLDLEPHRRSSACTTGCRCWPRRSSASPSSPVGVALFMRRDLGRHGRPLPAAPARPRAGRPWPGEPGVRRHAAAGARLGDRPRS